jgi:hypothetical protein
VRTVIDGEYYYSSRAVTFYLTGYLPTLSPTVKDVSIPTTQLTGDENTIIKGYNIVEYAINAQAKKGAYIVEQGVTCGGKVSTTATGELNNVEDNEFYFYVKDSRGYVVNRIITMDMINYIPLTCNQTVTMEVTSDTWAIARLNISGNYYNGGFGAMDNSLSLRVKYTIGDYDSGWLNVDEWDMESNTTQISGNSYSRDVVLNGFNYNEPVTFQCRCADMVAINQSTEYIVNATPVFDWGKDDFSFNVPVAIQGGRVYGAHILSDTRTTGEITLSDDVSNYEYIEIIYSDNNNRAGGTVKIYNNGFSSRTVELSMTEARGTTATYLRRTSYVLSGNTLTPNITTAGYIYFYKAVGGAYEFNMADGTNYIYVDRVIGYK